MKVQSYIFLLLTRNCMNLSRGIIYDPKGTLFSGIIVTPQNVLVDTLCLGAFPDNRRNNNYQSNYNKNTEIKSIIFPNRVIVEILRKTVFSHDRHPKTKPIYRA